MKKKLIGEIVFIIFLFGLVGFMTFTALRFPRLAQYSPVLIGGLALTVLVILLIQSVIKLRRVDHTEAESASSYEPVKEYRMVGIIVMLIGILPLIYLFGLIPAAALVLALYFKLFVKKSIVKSLIIAILTCGIVYLVFEVILRVRLPWGIIW